MHGFLEDHGPESLNFTQSLSDPRDLKAAVAVTAGLSSVSLEGPVQNGSEALFHLLTCLGGATILGTSTLRGLIAAAAKNDAKAGRARFTVYFW